MHYFDSTIIQLLYMYISHIIQIFFQIKTQEKHKTIQIAIQTSFKGYPNTKNLAMFKNISNHVKMD